MILLQQQESRFAFVFFKKIDVCFQHWFFFVSPFFVKYPRFSISFGETASEADYLIIVLVWLFKYNRSFTIPCNVNICVNAAIHSRVSKKFRFVRICVFHSNNIYVKKKNKYQISTLLSMYSWRRQTMWLRTCCRRASWQLRRRTAPTSQRFSFWNRASMVRFPSRPNTERSRRWRKISSNLSFATNYTKNFMQNLRFNQNNFKKRKIIKKLTTYMTMTHVTDPLSFDGSRWTGPCSAIIWSAATPETSHDLIATSHSSLSFLSLDTSVYGLTSRFPTCGCNDSSVGEFRTSRYAFNVIVFFTACADSFFKIQTNKTTVFIFKLLF